MCFYFYEGVFGGEDCGGRLGDLFQDPLPVVPPPMEPVENSHGGKELFQFLGPLSAPELL